MKRNAKDGSKGQNNIIKFTPYRDNNYNRILDDPIGFENDISYDKTQYDKKRNLINFSIIFYLTIVIISILIVLLDNGYVFPEHTIKKPFKINNTEIQNYNKSEMSLKNQSQLLYSKSILANNYMNDGHKKNKTILIDNPKYNKGRKNPNTTNKIESIMYDICKSYNFYDYTVENIYNISRTIFYYNDYAISRKVSRELFLKADSINRNYLMKVRTKEDKTGCDIYLNDGKSYYFIISIRYKPSMDILPYAVIDNNSSQNNVQNTELEKKMAIIVDDVGDTLQYRDFLKLDFPMTFSIIPLRKYSTNAAHEISLFDKHTVIIHAPFESGHKDKKEVVTFYIKDDDNTIREKLDDFIKNVPFSVGMNNHQGSKATSDPEFMNRFMKIFSEKSLFFIDSLTTHKSVAYEKAILNDVYALKRDVFLDNENNYEYIKSMYDKSIEELSSKNYVIVVGHSTKDETLKFFKNTLEKINYKKFTFINTQKLVKLIYYY